MTITDAKFTHSTWVLYRHRTTSTTTTAAAAAAAAAAGGAAAATTTTTKINAISVLTNKCK